MKKIIGLDILRFLGMFGIIGLHIINQGGVLQSVNTGNYRFYLVLVLVTFFYTSVNVFGLLSGYLNINKEKNKNFRIVELVCITFFYCALITSIFYIFNICDVRTYGIKVLIHSLFPPLVGRYWYITCYILLFFLIPYLNLFVKNISQSNYKKLLILLFVFFSIIPNVFLKTDFFKISDGYSPFWLMYCYLIGGYVRLYNPVINHKLRKFFISLFFAFILNLCVRFAFNTLFDNPNKLDWFISYTSPFILCSSFLLLLIFIDINLENKVISRIFSMLSQNSFGVYIIHCHLLIFDYLYLNNFTFVNNHNGMITLLLILLIISAIYIVCTALECLRVIIFRMSRFNLFINFLGEKIDKALK